ncbi:hypothetical protein [Mesorhizobium sp. J8]|uniref:hypothetical protein n=1 Tax=Mesorhizobium sp. J8 TaxID=2777475 RepID=UPI0019157ABE|nr:hypothetical protein [Mesorhizobium sp. J8]
MAGPVEREFRAAGNAVKGVGWKAKPIRFVDAGGNIIARYGSPWRVANGLDFANCGRALV